MSGADIERSYRQCMKREMYRERKWRMSKRYGNVRNMAHICDFAAAEAAEESPSWLSDKGAGASSTLDAVDWNCFGNDDAETVYSRRLRAAREKVRRSDPSLVRVFNLIVRNGRNRKESIYQLLTAEERRQPDLETTQAWGRAKQYYWDALRRLEKFFGLKRLCLRGSSEAVSARSKKKLKKVVDANKIKGADAVPHPVFCLGNLTKFKKLSPDR